MAGKELYTVEEVIDGLEGSDFEESEDDFEGYLDMDSGDDVCDEEQVECGEGEEQEAVVGLAMSEGDEGSERLDSIERLEPIPSYTLQPGCSEFVEGENPLDYFSLLFTDEIFEHIVEHTNLYATQYIETHEVALCYS